MQNTTEAHVKNIALLGATGTIGKNTLDVLRHLGRERVRLRGVSAYSKAEALINIVEEFNCEWAAVSDPDAKKYLAQHVPDFCKAIASEDQLCEQLQASDIDVVLCAVLGNGGLHPVLSAIRARKDVALASKEVLVMAGELVRREAERYQARILPVDSEHSAVFQCFDGKENRPIRRIILTASGGPFHGSARRDLSDVTVEEALRHPTWSMGRKITIDSATLMNKALEVIEAYWLFGVPGAKIEVLVHPQSIVHSMVEFVDGSIMAQLGQPDMRAPIQHAITYPEVSPGVMEPFDFTQCPALTFEHVDTERFPAVDLAREALAKGGTAPTVLNAANDTAVEAFCRKQIRFDEIVQTAASAMREHSPICTPALEDIKQVDAETRQRIAQVLFRS